ncbi:MAG: hypothetical protein WCI73_19855 [Phycisphaerae bacterium]
MKTAPVQLRKGFDAALYRVLKTDAKTLFIGYANIAPEAAPIIEDSTEIPESDLQIRGEIAAILDALTGDSLRALATTVKAFAATAA